MSEKSTKVLGEASTSASSDVRNSNCKSSANKTQGFPRYDENNTYRGDYKSAGRFRGRGGRSQDRLGGRGGGRNHGYEDRYDGRGDRSHDRYDARRDISQDRQRDRGARPQDRYGNRGRRSQDNQGSRGGFQPSNRKYNVNEGHSERRTHSSDRAGNSKLSSAEFSATDIIYEMLDADQNKEKRIVLNNKINTIESGIGNKRSSKTYKDYSSGSLEKSLDRSNSKAKQEDDDPYILGTPSKRLPNKNGSNKFGNSSRPAKGSRFNSKCVPENKITNVVVQAQSHPELFSYEELSQELLQQKPVLTETNTETEQSKPAEKSKKVPFLKNNVKLSDDKGQGNIPNEFKRRKKPSRLTILNRIRKGIPVNSDDDEDEFVEIKKKKKIAEEKKQKILELLTKNRLSRERTREESTLSGNSVEDSAASHIIHESNVEIHTQSDMKHISSVDSENIESNVKQSSNTETVSKVVQLPSAAVPKYSSGSQSNVKQSTNIKTNLHSDANFSSSDSSDSDDNFRRHRKSEAHMVSDNLASDLAKFMEKELSKPKDLRLSDLKEIIKSRSVLNEKPEGRKETENNKLVNQMKSLDIGNITQDDEANQCEAKEVVERLSETGVDLEKDSDVVKQTNKSTSCEEEGQRKHDKQIVNTVDNSKLQPENEQSSNQVTMSIIPGSDIPHSSYQESSNPIKSSRCNDEDENMRTTDTMRMEAEGNHVISEVKSVAEDNYVCSGVKSVESEPELQGSKQSVDQVNNNIEDDVMTYAEEKEEEEEEDKESDDDDDDDVQMKLLKALRGELMASGKSANDDDLIELLREQLKLVTLSEMKEANTSDDEESDNPPEEDQYHNTSRSAESVLEVPQAPPKTASNTASTSDNADIQFSPQDLNTSRYAESVIEVPQAPPKTASNTASTSDNADIQCDDTVRKGTSENDVQTIQNSTRKEFQRTEIGEPIMKSLITNVESTETERIPQKNPIRPSGSDDVIILSDHSSDDDDDDDDDSDDDDSDEDDFFPLIIKS